LHRGRSRPGGGPADPLGSGQGLYYHRQDSGRKITREFCPNCGAPLFTRAEKYPDAVFLKAGSLDEPQQIKPSCQTWTKRAVPWAHIDERLPCFPEGRPTGKE
ncbi:MAG: GFA family protein, partial [Planctomycetes bacterium]|nr:GFA family protein [Planctomycetota bacterium]